MSISLDVVFMAVREMCMDVEWIETQEPEPEEFEEMCRSVQEKVLVTAELIEANLIPAVDFSSNPAALRLVAGLRVELRNLKEWAALIGVNNAIGMHHRGLRAIVKRFDDLSTPAVTHDGWTVSGIVNPPVKKTAGRQKSPRVTMLVEFMDAIRATGQTPSDKEFAALFKQKHPDQPTASDSDMKNARQSRSKKRKTPR